MAVAREEVHGDWVCVQCDIHVLQASVLEVVSCSITNSRRSLLGESWYPSKVVVIELNPFI